MRAAAIGDAWRRLRRRHRVLKRVTVAWKESARLSEGSFSVSHPITLICGENGAGKTSLLHLFYVALCSQRNLLEHGRYYREDNSEITKVEIEVFDEKTHTYNIKEGNDVLNHFLSDEESLVLLVDMGMHIPGLIQYVRNQVNFNDLLEGVTPRVFSKEELEQVSYIVGRYYDSIEVYEVIDSSFGPMLPVFVVSSYGTSYGMDGMGYGELSAIYFVWLMERLAPGALLLIEEPEAFLTPRSQIALVNVMAKNAGIRDLTIIMTSHSGAIASRLESYETTYVARGPGKVECFCPPRIRDLIDRLGLLQDRQCLLFVEDYVASIFTRSLLDMFSTRLSGMGEFVLMNGEGAVRSLVEAIPLSIESVAHLGILDGDQVLKVAENDPKLVCLPGGKAPEVLLREYVLGNSLDATANTLHCQQAQVSLAMAHASGSDIHEWIGLFSSALNMGEEEVIRRLTVSWASDVNNSSAVKQFIDRVEARAGALAGAH